MEHSEDEAGGGFMQRMMGSWGGPGSRHDTIIQLLSNFYPR